MKHILILLSLVLISSTSLAQFNVGDQVQVALDTDCLNVRSLPVVGDNILKCEVAGTKGTIMGGPTVGGSYTFWQITYADGITGWSAGQYLAKIGSVPPPVDTSSISIQLKGFKVIQVLGDSAIIVKPR